MNLIDSIPLCGLTIYLLLIPRHNTTLLSAQWDPIEHFLRLYVPQGLMMVP
jgi:hypothetical protein